MKKYTILLLTFSIFSCGKVKQIDTSDITEIMQNYKVKRITEKDFMGTVSKIGEDIEQKINGDFKIECQNKIELDNQTVELYNSTLLNIQDIKESKKKELLEAYQYGIQNKQHIGSNIQILNDTLYCYSFVIKEDAYLHSVCKNDLALVMISKTEIIKKFQPLKH